MNQKLLRILFLGAFVFVLLVFFNYVRAQKAIRDTKESPLNITLVSFPESLRVGSKSRFIWHIEGSPDLYTSLTTIYWGYESSPSALSRLDSPLAVGYPYSLPDYQSGNYKIPSDFSLDIPFTRAGKVYFRAYSNVRNEHLWSEEKSFNVTK